jgi:hypothetical protein
MNLSQLRRAVWLRRLSDASQSRFTLLKNHQRLGWLSVKAYDDAITRLDELVDRRHQVLKTAADKVAGKSSNLLKARVRKDRLPETYVSTLCRLFEATGTQQVEEGCSEWVRGLLAEDESGGWASLRKDNARDLRDENQRRLAA